MRKKVFASLAIAFSLGTVSSFAQGIEQDFKVFEKDLVREMTDSLKSVKLLADKVELKELIRREREAREASIKAEIKAREFEENLNAPAEDVYGEGSWTQSFNPVANASIIPNSYEIDLSGFVAPIKYYRTTSSYGMRGRGWRRRMHKGVDLKLYTGEEVRAVFDGKVRIKRYDRRGFGYYYVIRHTNGLETVYGHLSKHIAKAGQIVRAGDVIGLGGNTGRSTGSHLHFEARFCGIPINPQMLFDFKEGVARMDSYTFHKRKRSSRHYAKKKSGHFNVYRVRRGDSLSRIAQRNHTTVTRICRANHISRSKILRPGERLLIP